MPQRTDSPSCDDQLAAARAIIARLEQQLCEAQKMEPLGLLAGGIVHDFNNLLMVINGYSDMLLHLGDLPGEAREFIEAIRDSGVRATALVRGLLGFSRRLPSEPRIVDLNEAVGGLASVLSRLLPADIRFTTVLEPQLQMVRADSGAVQQALLNLVVNSRDAMPRGGTLEIRTANLALDGASSGSHPQLPEGPYVLLTVSDNGAGMDDETKQHLFEPFYTTKPGGAGTGLGLTMVQQIVKQSGGFIRVQSESGRGTTVSIYLPCSGEEKTAEVHGPETRPRRGSETILLAEDSGELLRFLRDSLDGLGYTVLAAASAAEAEALASALEDSPDLLVADVVLPDATGGELARRLRESRPGLRVLFISGYTHGAAIERIQESGSDFLSKPFDLAVLSERIRGILDQRRRPRILFIDDEASMARLASRILSDAGYEVLVASNGKAALTTVETEDPDLVITDLVMPDVEGLEIIMALRRRRRSLPVIAISGAFGGQFLETAAVMGARATLAKPFRAEELLAAVRKALGTGGGPG